MASVVAKIEDAPTGPTPANAGVAVRGEVVTRPVVTGDDRPLYLWVHELSPGASLSWDAPVQDHLVYVWEGMVSADRQPIRVDEAFVVEHNGKGVIEAGDEPAIVLHFHRPEDYPHPASRSGGSITCRL